jgi:RNA polymerase sigma-70 factor (ECF subfamily)
VKDSNPISLSSDQDLVVRAIAGDAAAFNGLVTRHHAVAYRVALGILGDEDAAADATQEAFLKAFRGLKSFRGDASFRTWLLTIATNEARGALRKRGRRKETPLERAGPVSARVDAVDEVVERNQEAERIKGLLGELPDKQRQAVTLRIFEDLSFRDIGDLIGSSEGAARVNYHHGIRRLREMLE